MTYRDAMLLLIDKTDRAVEAAKVIAAIDRGLPTAETRAVKLLRVAVAEAGALTDEDRAKLRALLPAPEAPQQNRTETVRFRCTPNERAALELLAAKYAGGNLSRLILDALQKCYPTL